MKIDIIFKLFYYYFIAIILSVGGLVIDYLFKYPSYYINNNVVYVLFPKWFQEKLKYIIKIINNYTSTHDGLE